MVALIVVAAFVVVTREQQAGAREESGEDLPYTAQDLAGDTNLPAGSSQAEALADGNISVEEYNEATRRVLECGAARGLTPILKPGSGRQPDRPSFEASGDAGITTANTIAAECYNEHLRDIARVWDIQGVTSLSLRNAAFATLAACMQQAGVETREGFTLESFQDTLARMTAQSELPEGAAWLTAYGGCRTTVEQAHGFKLP
jgi:hypothetical protein